MKRNVAIHESSHAVVAAAMGHAVDVVWIGASLSDGKWSGQTCWKSDHPDDSIEDSMIKIAGRIGETLFASSGFNPRLNRSEARALNTAAGSVAARTGRAASDIAAEAVIIVRVILTDHASLIEKIADRLECSGLLGPSELGHLLAPVGRLGCPIPFGGSRSVSKNSLLLPGDSPPF